MDDLLERLRIAVDEGELLTDPTSTEAYRHDEAAWAGHSLPRAVVRPRTAVQVRDVVRACLPTRTPVVARGAGSGLSGGANAVDGCVVVSFEKMDQVLEVDALERLAVAQPGVVNDDLRARVAADGLWYPPDPASADWSTIGGNVATNAGGLCCVKYGVTRDYVLGLQVVTGTGELVRIGRRTAKGVAGYDLVGLMVGSEGTLGLVTEITVRLRRARPSEQTVVGRYADLESVGRAVTAVAASGVVASAVELLDRRCLEAVDAWKNLGLSAGAEALLLVKVDGVGAAGDAEAEAVLAALEQADPVEAMRSTDPAEAEALFAARKLAHPALERMGSVLSEDVCVPLAAVAQMLARIGEAGAAHDVLIATIGHAGDGNLHPLLVTPLGDEAARVRAHAAFEQIMSDALDLGGTITGEHGVGLLKLGGLRREQAPAVLAMQQAIKAALDPYGILNPGKAIAAG